MGIVFYRDMTLPGGIRESPSLSSTNLFSLSDMDFFDFWRPLETLRVFQLLGKFILFILASIPVAVELRSVFQWHAVKVRLLSQFRCLLSGLVGEVARLWVNIIGKYTFYFSCCILSKFLCFETCPRKTIMLCLFGSEISLAPWLHLTTHRKCFKFVQ